MGTAPHVIYEFDEFRIDPDHGSVLRDGQPLAVTPKVLEVLLALLRHDHETVTKDELLQAVWPGRVVEEANLSQCVFVLRKLLGDTHDQRRYIVTLPGKGYRFAGEVRTLAVDGPAADPPPPQDPPPAIDHPPVVQPAAPTVRAPARRGVFAVTGALAIAVILLGSGYFIHHRIRTGVPAPAAIPQKSVAVLPFANATGAQGQQFFSDGLSEDLITALSQFNGLKVISRDSAFRFRNSKDTAAEIGHLLGVAHLLEGSVQRQGDEVQINVALVNAADGSVLWSQRYDKPYTDLFALQDAITGAVAGVLKAKLLNVPGEVVQNNRPPSESVAAWTALQQGEDYFDVGSQAGTRKAIAAYREAIQIDPHYTAAYAALSNALQRQATVFANRAATYQMMLEARAAAKTAIELDPASAVAHVAYANWLVSTMDWRAALPQAREAVQLAPHDAVAVTALGYVLAALGQNREAASLQQRALVDNPLNADGFNDLSVYFSALGETALARKAIATAIALRPVAADQHEGLTIVEIQQGDAQAALTAAGKETDPAWREIALALALQVGPDRASANAALNKLIADHASDAAYQVAEVYALRRDPDAMFEWLDRAWSNRDPGIAQLLGDPFILRYRQDPRFAAFCKKAGLPATTDAVAMK